MKTPFKIDLLFVALLVALFFSLPAAALDRIPVFVSIAPQKYFVQQIGKDRVEVGVMVPPGADPHTYEPRPRQMVAISRARAYFAVGVALEKKWLHKFAAANPQMAVVHTDSGIEKLPLSASGHQTGAGHAVDHQSASGLDPHIWLSPPLVKIQARAISAALQEIDPAHRSVYRANLLEFDAALDRLDAELKIALAGKQGLAFMVFHPSWGYFAHAYGLRQIAVEFEGKEPKAAHLKELIELARDRGIRVVFAQPQFSSKSAELIAGEIGGRVAFADPMAGDWAANLRQLADELKAALK